MSEDVRIPGADFELQGCFRGGQGEGLVVAPPHPEYGGELRNPVVQALLDVTDRPRLGFNWRGVGRSDGCISADAGQAAADYSAAVDWLHARVEGPVWAAGYSFGAGTALHVAGHDPRIARLILVSPPLAMLESGLPDCRVPLTVILGDEDVFAPMYQVRPLVESYEPASLVVLEDVDHFYSQGMAALRTALTGVLVKPQPTNSAPPSAARNGNGGAPSGARSKG